jgi:hypothetical protein
MVAELFIKLELAHGDPNSSSMLVSFRTEGMDIRDRHYVSGNVMDALLCITPNCTKHPFHRIQKCGCQIVCNSEDFTPDTVEQESSEMSVQSLDNATESNSENIQNDEDVVLE